jgi:hypothetical protein
VDDGELEAESMVCRAARRWNGARGFNGSEA